MSASARGVQQRLRDDLAAAVNAAVRELPDRRMHLDPRLRGAPAAATATGTGLVLAGDRSAPTLAGEATSRACSEGGLDAAAGSAASAVALRAVSSAVDAGAVTVVAKVTASWGGVCVSLRARFPGPAAPGRRTGAAEVRVVPWGPGAAVEPDATGRDGRGDTWLFGVAVDAHGVLRDRSDVVVWYEVRRSPVL